LNTIATQAWAVDETGEKRAGEAFLRGSQAGQAGGLIAIPISIVLGSVTVRQPILLGGGLMVLLAVFLALTMTEEGFTPTPPEDRTTWAMMLVKRCFGQPMKSWGTGSCLVLATDLL
jgi:DHA3 family tetracycline resistance protein-like MFS transporter